ncbi:conserved hypothetical protein [Desulfosarcina cetonica]|uniref:hypothetical protein n=1 Tax=Desulfosarcina cetonica TaxID=90730 RepID=UPI0012EE4462|nr:hypothetical protein [Desulfosarcina cetonica]VTR69999.1 conserved hypothetical protein [Desulfosarcina cetonica]
MDASSVSASPMAMASAAQQMQTAVTAQMQMLQELAENQQEIAQMLVEAALGQNIDVMA